MNSPARERPAHHASARAQLDSGCLALGLALSEAQRRTLLQFGEGLLKWRRVYNLVGARSLSEVISHHVLDSLSVADAIQGDRLLDIGSGAGLPGLPIAVARPAVATVLLDANAKRVRFLAQMVQTLQLANVEVVRERAENYNPPQRFDCIISRALCAWPQYAALAAPLLSETGQILAMKGHFDEQAQVHGGVKIVEVRTLQVPGVAGRRCLVRGVREG